MFRIGFLVDTTLQ